MEDGVFSKQAEEELSKAVKLNPKFVEGWNALGECLWKKGDQNGSIRCFKAAISIVCLFLEACAKAKYSPVFFIETGYQRTSQSCLGSEIRIVNE